MTADLDLFTPLLGRWQTTGVVLDEHGAVTARIAGSDTYELMPGGGWVLHTVDVSLGDRRARALELIGEHDPADGTWTVHAFDADGSHATMQASWHGDGWLFTAEGLRAGLRPAADGSTMTATWERSSPTGWVRWMDLAFLRQPNG